MAMDIADALAFLNLDGATIDEAKLDAAYRALVKRFHPDSQKSFKEKNASTESLMAAQEARDLLRAALRDGSVPLKVSAQQSGQETRRTSSPEDKTGQSKNSRQQQHNPFIHTERQYYDEIHRPPFQWMLYHRWIGPVLMWPFVAGMFVALLSSMVILFVFMVAGALLYFVMLVALGEDRAKQVKDFGAKILDYMWSLIAFPLYYAMSGAGLFIWCEGRYEDWFLPLLAVGWAGISAFFFDELYSLVRYYVFLRGKSRRAVAILQEEG